jgi:hypothetical protein
VEEAGGAHFRERSAGDDTSECVEEKEKRRSEVKANGSDARKSPMKREIRGQTNKRTKEKERSNAYRAKRDKIGKNDCGDGGKGIVTGKSECMRSGVGRKERGVLCTVYCVRWVSLCLFFPSVPSLSDFLFNSFVPFFSFTG